MPEKNPETKACVIGWPVKHSRSPLIHGFWLKEHGIAGSYEKKAVRPEELEDFLRSLPESEWVGCNITIPHKEEAYRIVSEMNPSCLGKTAHRLRAINTVWLENGNICADNTDPGGFMANFRQCQPDWSAADKKILVMGAGGAARAVVAAFIDAGVDSVTVANRTVAKAEKLAADIGGTVIPAPLEGMAERLAETDVLVNATSLGMTGRPPLDLPLEKLPAHAVVADIVYTPLQTPLLRRAEELGLKTVDGLGMLLHQAAPGFEKWFGTKPQVTPQLRRFVEADLEK